MSERRSPAPTTAPRGGGRRTFGATVASLWFWTVFVVTAPLCFLLGALLFLVTAPFDPERHVLHAFICRWTFQYLRVWPGWRVQVRGRERLLRGPAILVANHQSMADVVAAMGLFHPYKFVSKASLFSLPLVGWMMWMARYVAIDRGRAGSTRQMMDRCRAWLRRGVPVLIFPEGTYSAGNKMLPFKRGAFVLAIEEQVPIIPVVLRGTSTLVHEDGPWMNGRADVEVEVLEPIQVNELGDASEVLSDRVRAALAAALGRGSGSAP